MLHAKSVEQLTDTVGGGTLFADNPTHIRWLDGYGVKDTALVGGFLNADKFRKLHKVLDDEQGEKFSVVHRGYFQPSGMLAAASPVGFSSPGKSAAFSGSWPSGISSGRSLGK